MNAPAEAVFCREWVALESEAGKLYAGRDLDSLKQVLEVLSLAILSEFEVLILPGSGQKQPSRNIERKFTKVLKRCEIELRQVWQRKIASELLRRFVVRVNESRGWELKLPPKLRQLRLTPSPLRTRHTAAQRIISDSECQLRSLKTLWSDLSSDERVGLLVFSLLAYRMIKDASTVVELLLAFNESHDEFEFVPGYGLRLPARFSLTKELAHVSQFDMLSELVWRRLASTGELALAAAELAEMESTERPQRVEDWLNAWLLQSAGACLPWHYLSRAARGFNEHRYSSHTLQILRGEVYSAPLSRITLDHCLLPESKAERALQEQIFSLEEPGSEVSKSFQRMLALMKAASDGQEAGETPIAAQLDLSEAAELLFVAFMQLKPEQRGELLSDTQGFLVRLRKLHTWLFDLYLEETKREELVLRALGVAGEHESTFMRCLVEVAEERGLGCELGEVEHHRKKPRIKCGRHNARILLPTAYARAQELIQKFLDVYEHSPKSKWRGRCQLVSLILGYRLGLRRSEIAGLLIGDLVGDYLLVRGNDQRGIKTPAGNRAIPARALMTPEEWEIVQGLLQSRRVDALGVDTALLLARCKDSKAPSPHWLFDGLLAILRFFSSDDSFRFHYLRHSFATFTYLRLSEFADIGDMFPTGYAKGEGDPHYFDLDYHQVVNAVQGMSLRGHGWPLALQHWIGHQYVGISLEHYIHSAEWVALRQVSRQLSSFGNKTLGFLSNCSEQRISQLR